ncbi:uncharacterized protein H6S33_003829 [Morchella sextelata]|uniref:uncharacterized protein n=1 Tax=Morchella sextelata TaxID=1174677 RepID=UPI001D04B2E7|nr:uncharacterized protein H6S33_003829 [Morchella sextelata]KAH0606168.1 hypothetical protein H6S33_003829 [Morchella sextelata]
MSVTGARNGDLESQLPDIRPVSNNTENNTEKKSDDGLTLVTGVQHDSLKVPSSRFSSTTALYKESNAVEDLQQQLHDLIVDVGTAFISHGGPSHRVQPVIEALGQVFDVPTNVHTMNSQTVISFPPKNKRGPPAMYPIIKRGSMNFTKLPYVFDLVKRIVRDPAGLTMPNIYAELERIESLESAWNQYAVAASYVPAAATSAIMFFGGDWKDAAMSGALALIPAALLLVANRWERLWWTYECIACFLVSLVATILSKHFCYSTLILSAPVTLLPGYTVSISVVEIMTKNTIAGCIRLVYTVVYLCCMVLGFTLAPILYNAPGNMSGDGFQRLPVDLLSTCNTSQGIVVNKFWLLLCVPVYICAYNIYLKTPWRQWPSMIVIGSLGYGAGFASKYLWHAPPEFNAFAASFTLGVFSNMYARVTDEFAFNAIVAGVFIQVPGSWGIRGLLSFAYGDYEKGIYWNYSMLAICVSISLALIISNHIFFGFKLLNRGAPHLDF